MNENMQNQLPRNTLDSKKELTLLEQCAAAEEFIKIINESTTTEGSSNFTSQEINEARLQDEKTVFEQQVGDVATLIMRLDAIGEKVVAKALATIYRMNIQTAEKVTQDTLKRM